jgi:hypothetical protein
VTAAGASSWLDIVNIDTAVRYIGCCTNASGARVLGVQDGDGGSIYYYHLDRSSSTWRCLSHSDFHLIHSPSRPPSAQTAQPSLICNHVETGLHIRNLFIFPRFDVGRCLGMSSIQVYKEIPSDVPMPIPQKIWCALWYPR